jgi:hypothetical protein
MTYNYATKQGSAVYHLFEAGYAYALCVQWVRTGKRISSLPPAGKRECQKCAKVAARATRRLPLPNHHTQRRP